MSKSDIRREYNRLHAVCPVCFGKNYETTCMAVFGFCLPGTRVEDQKDTNNCHCSCGWTGIVHDLVPDPAARGTGAGA